MKISTLKTSLLLLACTFVLNSNAQTKSKDRAKSSSTDKIITEGSGLLNIGVGFGSGNYHRMYKGSGYRYKVNPAFSLSYEQALPKKVGPGILTLGAYLGYQTSNVTYDYYWDHPGYKNYYYYRYRWTNFMIAARGAYHLDALNFSKGEIYFGAHAGLRLQSFVYETNNPDPNADIYRINSGNLYPTFSIFAGGRVFLTDRIGLFGELGYGITYFTAGLTFKI